MGKGPPFGPLATIVSKAIASAPRRRISNSRATGESLRWCLAQELLHLCKSHVCDVRGAFDARHLALVLDGAERLDGVGHR